MITWKEGDDFILEENMIVIVGEREYQARPAIPKGSCVGCFGAEVGPEGNAVHAICLNLPPCSRMVEGQEGQMPEINVVWKDVSEVAF